MMIDDKIRPPPGISRNFAVNLRNNHHLSSFYNLILRASDTAVPQLL